MKCKDCKLFSPIKSDIQFRVGLCKFNNEYEMTHAKDNCHYEFTNIKPLTCGDCQGRIDDYGCMTCEANDTFASKCEAVRPKVETTIFNYLIKLDKSGVDYNKRFKLILENFKKYKKKLEER